MRHDPRGVGGTAPGVKRDAPDREVGTVGLIQPNEGFREKWDPRHADSVWRSS